MKILLVEDNPGQASVAQSFLQLGLPDSSTTHVTTLAQGVRAVKDDSFDVVLLDLGLPDGDGLDVVISMAEAALDVPIVILTAQGDEEGLGPLCIQAGASDFICKRDLTPESLVRAVEFSSSRKTESVVRDLSRLVSEFRLVAGADSGEPSERFGHLYEKLITDPHFLLTSDHEDLVKMMGDAGLTGSQAIALHANCVENVCRTADDRAQARYLDNCQTVLAATLRYLVDYYRDQATPAQ